jgi:quinol monooxygenase YgiN
LETSIMAEVAADDDGCEIYTAHEERMSRGTFRMYHLYRGRDALKLHQAIERLHELGERLRRMTDSVDVTLGKLVGGDRSTRA